MNREANHLNTFEKVMRHYSAWLASHDDEIENGPEVYYEDLQRYSFLRAVVPTSWHTVVLIAADYGDDGGPAELTVLMNPLDLGEIDYIIQAFDTDARIIYER